MASVNTEVDATRARSRSRTGRQCSDGGHGSSSRTKTVKRDSLPPDVPRQCSHLPPPPYRPAGPFALYFAANHASADAKNVIDSTTK